MSTTLEILAMPADLCEVVLKLLKLLKSLQFGRRLQVEQEKFAKSIKVNLTEKVVSWQLDQLDDAVEQLEIEVK